jgi:hypothetical protein
MNENGEKNGTAAAPCWNVLGDVTKLAQDHKSFKMVPQLEQARRNLVPLMLRENTVCV